jgi:hypothetical protein
VNAWEPSEMLIRACAAPPDGEVERLRSVLSDCLDMARAREHINPEWLERALSGATTRREAEPLVRTKWWATSQPRPSGAAYNVIDAPTVPERGSGAP